MSTTRPNGLSSTLSRRSGRAGADSVAIGPRSRRSPAALAGVSVTVSVKVVPPPRRCATTMSPPMARASCLTEDSPSPAPPKREAIETLACENGRNSRLISASVRPMPLSETAKATPTLPLAPRSGVTCKRDAALLGEFHGIVDQVFQRRAQPDRIADHERRQLFGNLDRRLQALGRRPAGQRIAGVAGQRAQIEEILPDRRARDRCCARHRRTASQGSPDVRRRP